MRFAAFRESTRAAVQLGGVDPMDDLSGQGAALRRTARAILGSGADADDVTQEAWLRVASGRRPERGRALAWLRGVVRNVRRTNARSIARERAALRDRDVDARASADDADEPTVDAAMAAETAVLIARAVEALPDHYREVVVRRYWRGDGVAKIAADLGVPPKTVSNRLHRALAALRVELGPTADRRLGLAWLAAPTLRDLALPALAMKSYAVPALSVAALLTFVLAFFGLRAGFDRVDGRIGAPTEADLARVERVEPRDAPTSDLVAVDGATTDRTDAVAPADGGDVHATTRDAPALGSVSVRFVDADTGRDLSDVELRGATDDRFLARDASSPTTLALTPGRWTLAARAAPFEVVEIDPFDVVAGEDLDLGKVELRRGWATITAVVDVPEAVAGGGDLRVQLFGRGRSTCAEHRCGQGDRCEACGYGVDSTDRTVDVMELFHFDGLAAGVYSLLVFDGEERILFNERVALATGEAARVDLRMEFIDVEFAITGPAGEPFVGVWEEDGQEYEGPVEFYFRSDGVACASARTAARSAFGFTKNPDGTVTRMPVTDRVLLRDPEVIAREKAARDVVAAALANSARDMQLAVGNEEMLQMLRSLDAPTPALEVSEPPPVRVPDDHPREEGEEPGFAPWSESPQVETRPLRAKRVAPGLYRVEKVPMQADGVLVTSGPYFVSTAIDLRRRGGVPVEIAFTSRCNATSELFVGARSCFDCHGEQGVATMGW